MSHYTFQICTLKNAFLGMVFPPLYKDIKEYVGRKTQDAGRRMGGWIGWHGPGITCSAKAWRCLAEMISDLDDVFDL